MPDPDDQPPSQPTPATPPDSQAVIAAALQQLLQPSPQPQVDQTPVERTWLSRLGGSLAGGLDPSIPMSPAQKQAAGMRALGDFGTSLMAASHYVPGQTIFSNLAQGFQGAQKGLLGSETTAAELLGAQQSYQQKQQEMQVERLKTALPLLTLSQQQAAVAGLKGTQPGALTTTASPGSLAAVLQRDPSIPVAGAQANNPGNLMFAGQPGASKLSLSGGRTLAAFPDMPSGIAANANQILINQDTHGINTVRGMVRQWVLGPNPDPKAPQPDLTTYTADTAKALGVDPDAKVDFHDPAVLSKFITAQQPHETGGKGGITLNPDDVTKGVQMALGGYKAPAGPPAATAAAAPPAASTTPRGAATLPTPPLPPEGMLPSPIGAPAAAPASTAGQPAGGAVVAGPPGAATVGAARPPGPAVPGDVNAILRGMVARGAAPATLAAGPAPGGPATLAAGPAVTGGAQATAVAQAQATNTPVPVPGVKDLWALPNGQLTGRPPVGMPATAPQPPPPAAPTPPPTSQTTPPPAPPPITTPPQPPAPSRVPDTFTATRVPLPPDVQDRINNPGKYIPPDLQQSLQGQITVEGATAAKKAIADAADKVRADAIAQGETIQQHAGESQQAVWKTLHDEQAAKDKQAVADATAERQTILTSDLARKNADAAEQGKRNTASLDDYRSNAAAGSNAASAIAQGRSVLAGMSQSPTSLMNNPTAKALILAVAPGATDLATKATNNEMFESAMQRAADAISPKTIAGGERPGNITQYRLMLPGLSTSPEGRELALNYAGDIAQNRQDQYEWMVNHKNDDAFLDKRIGEPDLDKAEIAMRKDPTVMMPALPPVPPSFDKTTVGANKDWQKAYSAYLAGAEKNPGQPYYTWKGGDDGRMHAVKYTWTKDPNSNQLVAAPAAGTP